MSKEKELDLVSKVIIQGVTDPAYIKGSDGKLHKMLTIGMFEGDYDYPDEVDSKYEELLKGGKKEEAMHYLQDYHWSRITPENMDIDRVYTDGLVVCTAVIVRSSDNKYISLYHDAYIDNEATDREIASIKAKNGDDEVSVEFAINLIQAMTHCLFNPHEGDAIELTQGSESKVAALGIDMKSMKKELCIETDEGYDKVFKDVVTEYFHVLNHYEKYGVKIHFVNDGAQAVSVDRNGKVDTFEGLKTFPEKYQIREVEVQRKKDLQDRMERKEEAFKVRDKALREQEDRQYEKRKFDMFEDGFSAPPSGLLSPTSLMGASDFHGAPGPKNVCREPKAHVATKKQKSSYDEYSTPDEKDEGVTR